MLEQEFITTNESSQAQFLVVFTPQRIEIPFTIVVKTSDSYSIDAEGLSCSINGCTYIGILSI